MKPDAILCAADALKKFRIRNPTIVATRYRKEDDLAYPFSPNTWTVERHLKWMLDQIPRLVDEGRLVEAVYNLAFVEGKLWSSGTFSMDALVENHMAAGFEISPA